MTKHRVPISLGLLAALLFVGCKGERSEQIAPSTKKPNDLPKSQFKVTPSDDGLGTLHTVVRTTKTVDSASKVVWHSASPFTVVFDPQNDPCTVTAGSGQYPSSPVNGKNEVTCTIADPGVGAPPYYYLIYPNPLPLDKKKVLVPGGGDHCEGCVIDEEDAQ